VNARAADCLSANKHAVEITTAMPASLAVDGNENTHSCTETGDAFPWWAVDLGQDYNIASVTITFPSVNGDNRNYRSSCSIH